ncbi:MAG: cyclophilin-like fold protein, partial [Nitrososphaera sp.]
SISCELVRHLAPTTARSILTSLPLQGLVHRFGELFVYFETGLVIGSEKQRTRFKRGEMGLLVSNGSICIFLKDSSAQPMNPLGNITGDLRPIESSRPGDAMKLKKSTV